MGVAGDGEKAVRAAIASAPQLAGPWLDIPEQDKAGIGKMIRPAGGSTGANFGRHRHSPAKRRKQAAADVACNFWPPSCRSDDRFRRGEQRHWPPGAIGWVYHQPIGIIAVALTRCAKPAVEDGRPGVGHACDAFPQLRWRHPTRRHVLRGRHHEQFENETMILAGLFAIQAIGEDLPHGLGWQLMRRRFAPALTLRKPGKGTRADEEADQFGYEVIVGRRTVTAEAGEILLVAIDLRAEKSGLFEAIADTPPSPQQPACPGKRDKPNPHFYSAGPMNAGQEWIGFAPGLNLAAGELGKDLPAGDEPGGRKDSHMLQSGRFEQEFMIAHDRRISCVDIEGIVPHWCNAGAVGVYEPVSFGLRQLCFTAEQRQPACQQTLTECRYGFDRALVVKLKRSDGDFGEA